MSSARVIFGDSRSMEELEDSSIQLMVTSTPYWHLKDYGIKRQIGFGQSLHDYLRDVYRVWKETFRVLEPGRRACINIGDQFTRTALFGRYKVVPIHAEIIIQMERIGFDFMGSVIWRKRTTMNTSGGANIMGSYPYPPNGVVEMDYEHILIFKKPGRIRELPKEEKEASKLSKEQWKKHFISHWEFGGARQIGHEAMFPEELPSRLIRMFSLKGETVLDPFIGSGTTALAAAILGRNCIGYELNSELVDLIKEKVGKQGELTFEIATPGGKLPVIDDYEPSISDIEPVEGNLEDEITTYKVESITDDAYFELPDGRRYGFAGIEIIDIPRAVTYLERYMKRKQVILEGEGSTRYVYLKNRIFINKELIRKGAARYRGEGTDRREKALRNAVPNDP